MGLGISSFFPRFLPISVCELQLARHDQLSPGSRLLPDSNSIHIKRLSRHCIDLLDEGGLNGDVVQVLTYPEVHL